MKNSDREDKVMVPIEAKVLLTTAEAAAILSFSERTLRTLAQTGRIPCIRIPIKKGARALVRYRRATLDKWAISLENKQDLPDGSQDEDVEIERFFSSDQLE